MTKKTRSLLLLIGLLVALTVVIIVWRSMQRIDQMYVPPVVTNSVPAHVSTSVAVVTVPQPAATSATTTTPNTTMHQEEDLVSLLVVGDIMLDRNVAGRTKKSGDPLYPFRKLPEHWVSSFDVALANMEGSVTPERRPPVKSIDFQFDPSWLPLLKAQGWDAFSQANNHALDQGAEGYKDSVSRMRKEGFLVFGHQVDDGLIALATTTVKGQRLAFLGWNNTDNPVDQAWAAQAITQAKQDSDLVFAYLHWGNEYRDRPDAQNVTLAHWLIDQGVDVVIGGHPHWVQGISSYKGKPILWSLGNFIFDQDWSKETQQGLAIEFAISSSTIKFKPVPLSIVQSQPAREEGNALSARLQSLANISDESLRADIEGGKELVFERATK